MKEENKFYKIPKEKNKPEKFVKLGLNNFKASNYSNR